MKKIVFALFLMSSCSNETEKETITIIDSPKAIKVVSEKNSDTLYITSATAVMYEPDAAAIAKRKKSVGEENFMIGADDYLNYMHLAFDFFEKEKLPVLHAKTKNFLHFTSADGSKKIINLATNPELWGIYLFSPDQQPRLIDMTMYQDEYKLYLKKTD